MSGDLGAFHTLNLIDAATEIRGPKRAVLWALGKRADGQTGKNAYPSRQTLVDASGFEISAVKTALSDLEAMGVIKRGDQSRAPKSSGGGRPVVVWDIDLVRLLDFQSVPEEAQGSSPDPSKGRQATDQGSSHDHDLPMTFPSDLPVVPPSADTAGQPHPSGAAAPRDVKRLTDRQKVAEVYATVGDLADLTGAEALRIWNTTATYITEASGGWVADLHERVDGRLTEAAGFLACPQGYDLDDTDDPVAVILTACWHAARGTLPDFRYLPGWTYERTADFVPAADRAHIEEDAHAYRR